MITRNELINAAKTLLVLLAFLGLFMMPDENKPMTAAWIWTLIWPKAMTVASIIAYKALDRYRRNAARGRGRSANLRTRVL